MGKVKVPVLGTVGKAVQIETDAPSRAEVAADIALAISRLTVPGSSSGGSVTTVIWRFIREIPPNITNLANLLGTGLVTRKASDGSFSVRTLLAGTGIDVANGNGSAGNPTVSLDAVLDDLNDVDVPTPNEGDVLTFDGTSELWVAEPVSSGFPDATYITETDERADLPNSLRLLAGTGITFDITTAGEFEISASGGGGPTVPTIIGSSSTTGSASSLVSTIPGGSSAGDLAFIFTSHGWQASTPSGWSLVDIQIGSFINGAVFSKTLSSGDISTGSVTVSYAGSDPGAIMMVVLDAGTFGAFGLATSVRVSNPGAASAGFALAMFGGIMLLTYGGMRENAAAAVTQAIGTSLQNVAVSGASARVTHYDAAASGYAFQRVTFAGSPTGTYAAGVIVSGV